MGGFRVGQTRKDKRRGATSAFTTLKIYRRTYSDGTIATRVKGVLVTGVNGSGCHLRDLDERSALRMFPHILFDPPVEIDTEDK